MKILQILFLSLSVLLLAVSCDKAEESELSDYEVVKNADPLSDQEIESLFGALGLSYERFTCKLPERTKVRFSYREFREGEEQKSFGGGSVYPDGGEQDFFLFIRNEGDHVKFTLSHAGASASVGMASIDESNNASTQNWIPIKQLKEEKQPVYIYAANEGGIQSVSLPFDLEEAVSKYDYALVLFAAVEEKE